MNGAAVASEKTITSNSLRPSHNKITTISSAARLKNSAGILNDRHRTSNVASSGNNNDKLNASVRISSAPPTSNDKQTCGVNRMNSAAPKWNDESRKTAGGSIRNARLNCNGNVMSSVAPKWNDESRKTVVASIRNARLNCNGNESYSGNRSRHGSSSACWISNVVRPKTSV